MPFRPQNDDELWSQEFRFLMGPAPQVPRALLRLLQNAKALMDSELHGFVWVKPNALSLLAVNESAKVWLGLENIESKLLGEGIKWEDCIDFKNGRRWLNGEVFRCQPVRRSDLWLEGQAQNVLLDGHRVIQVSFHRVEESVHHQMALEQMRRRQHELSEQLEVKQKTIEEVLQQLSRPRRENEEGSLNLKQVLTPLLMELESKVDDSSRSLLKVIREKMDLEGSQSLPLLDKEWKLLTPKEVEICQLIAQNQSSAEIAQKCSLSLSTVEFHRKNIRKKLDLLGKGINLTTYLRRRKDPS